MSLPWVVPVYWWEIQMFHFAKPWRGLRLLTRVKVFCRFNSEFRWNSTLYEAGIFGTGYTSTHTQVNIQKTNYTLRRLHSLAMFDDLPGPLSSSFTGYAILSLNHSFVTSCFHPEPLNFYQISFRLLNLYPNGLKHFAVTLL